MKRLLILAQSLAGSGASLVISQLANYWAARPDIEVHIAVVRPIFAYPVPSKVTVHVLGKERPGLIAGVLECPLLVFRVRSLVRALSPDCVLGFTPGSNLLASLTKKSLKSGARIAMVERGPLVGGTPFLARLFWRAARRKVYAAADTVIAASEGLRGEIIERGVTSERVLTIADPCDAAEVVAQSREVPVSPHPWLEFCSEPLLVSTGRLVPKNNFSSLLRAFKAVLDEEPARLLILGEGPLEPALRRDITRLGLTDAVDLVPFVNNPYPTLKRASIYVRPSKTCQWPHALVEAMALGRPCVAYDFPWGPREVLQGQATGVLVAPKGDSPALARALLSLIRDPVSAREMGQRAKLQVQDFALPMVARQYESALF